MKLSRYTTIKLCTQQLTVHNRVYKHLSGKMGKDLSRKVPKEEK